MLLPEQVFHTIIKIPGFDLMSLNVTVINVYLSVLSDNLHIGFINWNSDKTLFIAFNDSYILSPKSPQTLENAKFIANEFALRLSLVLYPFPSCYELS